MSNTARAAEAMEALSASAERTTRALDSLLASMTSGAERYVEQHPEIAQAAALGFGPAREMQTLLREMAVDHDRHAGRVQMRFDAELLSSPAVLELDAELDRMHEPPA